MAGIESIQCPKCGSPLEVARSTLQARCSYCGSTLRVSRDASGQPLAVLDDIREDTDILATDVVRRRLEERLRERLAVRHNLRSAYAIALEKTPASAGCATWLVAAVGAFIGALVGAGLGEIVGPESVEGFSLLGVIVGGLIAWWLMDPERKATRTKVEEYYGPRLRALGRDVEEARRELGAATARMDGLIRDAGGH